MSQMIIKGKETIRISPTNKHKIEYSSNSGRFWNGRLVLNKFFGFNNDENQRGYRMKKKVVIFTM